LIAVVIIIIIIIITIIIIIIVTGWTTDGSEFESRWEQEFSLLVVQTGPGVHPTSYPVGTGGKAAEA
jgi:hypothetical protein